MVQLFGGKGKKTKEEEQAGSGGMQNAGQPARRPGSKLKPNTAATPPPEYSEGELPQLRDYPAAKCVGAAALCSARP